MARRNGYAETIARIDESLNGPMGLAAQMRLLQADMSGVKLVLVGGIDPATGKERSGLAQAFDHHVADHRKSARRNFAIFTTIFGPLLIILDRLLAYFGVK